MAIINKTGITNGGTIQAEHVTRAIDALSGVSTDSIIATGSFTGSFVGSGAGLTGVSVTTAATASYVLNAISSSFATTASYALNAAAASSFPFTGSAIISGSLTVTGSFRQFIPGEGVVIDSALSGSVSKLTLEHDEIAVNTGGTVTFGGNASLNLTQIAKGGGLRIPLADPGLSATTGSMYYDKTTQTLYIHDGNNWTYVTLTT